MKIVVTIGSGNSGAGAVHDYLIKSTNYKSPFKGQEFRILDDPDGILNLYYNFYKNCSINNPSNSIMRFRNYVEKLQNLKMKVNNKNIKIYNKDIIPLTDGYIKNITTLNYNALPQFRALQTSYLKKKFFKLKKKIFKSDDNHHLFKMYLPVEERLFLKQSKKYLNRIIKSQFKNRKINKIILDQTLNIWNFADIFSYFEDVKVILVTRDPRGIYNSMKNRQSAAYPGYSLKIWVKWYNQIMKKFSTYKKKIPKKFKRSILEIKFEDFVKNYEIEQSKILNFIGAKKKNNNFDIKKSKFNAFKAKKELSKHEKEYIKKKLLNYLQW